MQDELRAILTQPTGTSSSGYPYLAEHAWIRLRDWVPHTLDSGAAVWQCVESIEDEFGGPVRDAAQVIRQIVNTAAITAPPDLWLMRHILSALAQERLLKDLARGKTLVPEDTDFRPDELRIDLDFLLSRGVLVRHGEGFRAAECISAKALLHMSPIDEDLPKEPTALWIAGLSGEARAGPRLRLLLSGSNLAPGHPAPAWIATPRDVALGWLLVPLVLGLRATNKISTILKESRIHHDLLEPLDERTATRAIELLRQTGTLTPNGQLTRTGARMLRRGPGPFGIIETYRPYLQALPVLWRQGREGVHVHRAGNIAASQDANRKTFYSANDALDAFCSHTGFRFSVFIEHAVGCGEAIRQRWARSGDTLQYIGVDLEQAALDATRAAADSGKLPKQLTLVQADIGRPDVLVEAIKEAGLNPHGAVMMVGNGFHEARGADDARMIEVFRGYADAGILLLFTEESALALDDLLATAWNTYHAGFKYVHERSGQGLRPAQATRSRMQDLPMSWTECAEAAGYRRVDRWCSRSRTIYPHPTANGRNPSISENHFFVPPMLDP